MSRERVLIIGGGMSGLAAAGLLADRFDCLLVEREEELGGYCRTIYKNGFTWDYSGHFFHFRHKWIGDYVHARMDLAGLLAVSRRSRIYFRDQYVDYPFQFNIHQLPLVDFLRCLVDMYEANKRSSDRHFSSFRDMIHGRYGRALSELFLVPYNEKLYSVPVDALDPDAMGRFFPHVDFSTLLQRIRSSVEGTGSDDTYNAEFSYHKEGARAYVNALASYVPKEVIKIGTECEAIDPKQRQARIAGELISFDRLVISAPLPAILELAGEAVPKGLLTANKVLVFNLGFDRPSDRPDHWVYYPERDWVFFRVGHYDNILGQHRMSLYVEVAMPEEQEVDVEGLLPTVLADLERAGVIIGHKLVSWAAVTLDPAYVHITTKGQQFATTACDRLMAQNIFPIGRYGRWIYCSIEDNILEAHRLARRWGCVGIPGSSEDNQFL